MKTFPPHAFTFSCTMSDHVLAVTHDLLVQELSQVPQWDVLGTYLGLDESEIEVIERDHHGTARRRLVMLSKWMEKDVDASWEKVIDSLKSMSQIRLANLLKEKYCSSDSDPLAISAVCPAKPAESSPEKELMVDRQEFLEMETLGDDYLQLVMEAESAVEESDPPLKKLKRFSQCFMGKEILTVDELFDKLKPFYFLEYIMLEKIVKFFLGRTHSVADNLRDYLQNLVKFKSSTTVQHFMESIEQAQQSHSTTSERPGLCTVKLCLVGGWLSKTMDDLEKLLNEIFKDKRHVLSHLKIVRGSVIVTFSAPLSEADTLITLAREQSLFALKVGVSLLVVADTVITQSESTDFSFESSLLDSVKDNDPNLLKFLLSINTSSDAADEIGLTALMLACVYSHDKSVSLLLTANSNPNIQDNYGRAPLHIACQNGHTGTVALLLKANADSNIQDIEGGTPLYIASQEGYTDIVALLLEANANPNLQEIEGCTPLYIASQEGYTDIVALLLKANADLNLQGIEGCTPLFIASHDGHTDTVALLIKANADPNFQEMGDCTPLYIASQEGHTDIVALLLKANADPNLQEDNEAAPLYIASQEGHTDTVALLLKANANPNLQGIGGCTPLYIASQNGHTDTVDLLLKANANPNLQKDTGATPLYVANCHGHTDIANLLLDAGADLNLQPDTGILHFGYFATGQEGHSDSLTLFQEASLNQRHGNGSTTPLYTAGEIDGINLFLNDNPDTSYMM